MAGRPVLPEDHCCCRWCVQSFSVNLFLCVMVRNWQARVEAADTRRKQAKQRKRQSEDKRQNRQWVHDLLHDKLDRHRERLSLLQNCKIQIWTDAPPVEVNDRFVSGDGDVEDDHGSRKERSKSFGDGIVDEGRKKGRDRSSSTVDAPLSAGKKKAHPRSKEAFHEPSTATDTAVEDQPPLCRSYFFTGHCVNRGKKSGACRYVHNSKGDDQQTLCQALLCCNISNNISKQILERAEKAVLEASESAAVAAVGASATVERVDEAMEVVYYMETLLNLTEDGENFSDQIIQWLSRKKQLLLSNVVYICFNAVLVFDRHQNGVLYASDRDFLVAVLGSDAVVGSRRDLAGGGSADAVITSLLPGSVLEHILTFAPDEAIAAASQVCQAWRLDICQHLPTLWMFMLDRRGWPHPVAVPAIANDDNDKDKMSQNRDKYRDQFCQHYTVIRDMKSLQKGLNAISGPRAAAVVETEMAYQDFSSRKHAPSYPNACVGLQEWSPNRLLVAYDMDCSLRLFESVPKAGSTTGEKVCRELICQKIDPHRKTRKRQCRILAMALDDICAACLCHVFGGVDGDASYELVVISRDDFLLGESSGAADTTGGSAEVVPNLKVYDIGKAAVEHLLSLEVGDDELLQSFFNFVSDSGDVDIRVSHTLAACASGRFMVGVEISNSTLLDNVATILFARHKLVLFAATGAVVWMGDSYPQPGDNPALLNLCLSLPYLRRPRRGGSRTSCSFAVGSAQYPEIMVGDVDAAGEISGFRLLPSSALLWSEHIERNPGWDMSFSPGQRRPLLVSSTVVIAADVVIRREGSAIVERKSIISFFPRCDSSADEPSNEYTSFSLLGNLVALQMACIRDLHVVVICRQFNALGQPPIDWNDGEELDAVAGHWFGENVAAAAPHNNPQLPIETNTTEEDEVGEAGIVVAIIVHIPSRREMGRIRLLDGEPPPHCPHLVVDGNETIGLGHTWKGVVMTGGAFRSTPEEEEDDQCHSSRKKKKRVPAKAAKKDTFRTHNGDRCY